MGKTSSQKNLRWGYLLLAILFGITAFTALRDPYSDLKAIAFLLGIMPVIYGIWAIINYRQHPLRIITGIIEIIIGIFILLNITFTMFALPYLFSIWFVVSSILRLFSIGYLRQIGKAYFGVSLISNILGIVVGVLLFLHPLLSVLTIAYLVGFYFILIAIECLILFFAKPQIEEK